MQNMGVLLAVPSGRVIGMAIGLACLAMACIPGLNYLHTLFLFRTRRPKEEGLAEEAEDSTAALVHEDPLVNFFRTFAPECNIGNISPSRASGALRTSRSAPVIS